WSSDVCSSDLTNEREPDRDPFVERVPDGAGHADVEVPAELDVHAETERQLHVVADVVAQDRHHDRVQVRDEARLRALQQDAPAQRDADRDHDEGEVITELGADAEGERPVQREAFARLEHPGARAAAEQDAGLVRVVHEARAEADVPAVTAVAVEALQRPAGAARIGEGGTVLAGRERAVRGLEHRRAGFLGSGAAREREGRHGGDGESDDFAHHVDTPSTCSVTTRTRSSTTWRKPPRTLNRRAPSPCRTTSVPVPRSVMNGAWRGRMPTSPSNAGAVTESASPSNIADSGEITVTCITRSRACRPFRPLHRCRRPCRTPARAGGRTRRSVPARSC